MVRLSDALLLDIREWGVILREDAERRYTARIVSELIGTDFLRTFDGALGPTLYLSLKGRRRVGFIGRYEPEMSAVLNQLAVRDARAVMEQEEYTDLTPRVVGKYMFTAARVKGPYHRFYAVAARYTGFDFRAIRLLYRRLFVDSPESQRLSGLFVFVPPEDVAVLEQVVEPQQAHRPFLVPRRILRIRALPKSKPALEGAGQDEGEDSADADQQDE